MATKESIAQPVLKPPLLREQVDKLIKGVSVLTDDLERRNSVKADSAPRPRLTEADALARCIAALHELKDAETASRGNNYASPAYGSSYHSTWEAGDRILRFLAARFGVSLIEVQRPPCSRPHVDEVSPDAFFAAFRASVAQS